jgi:hypothetical protein
LIPASVISTAFDGSHAAGCSGQNDEAAAGLIWPLPCLKRNVMPGLPAQRGQDVHLAIQDRAGLPTWAFSRALFYRYPTIFAEIALLPC